MSRTLDILSSVDLTHESLDPTSLLYYDEDDREHDYLWILLRSTSNTLQVWNQSDRKLHGTVCLNHLFEKISRIDAQSTILEESSQLDSNDEAIGSSNLSDQIRITSFLIHNEQLWIGTSTGVIYVFNFTIQLKSLQTYPNNLKSSSRSMSVTGPMLNHLSRSYISPLPDLVNNNPKKSRSRSDSAMIDLVNSSDDCWNVNQFYRITFTSQTKDRSTPTQRRRRHHHSTLTCPITDEQTPREVDSGDTSTTLTSTKTRSSSPAVISTDEWCKEYRRIRLPSMKQQKSLEASASLSFSLVFKAKIADAPMKCICKTK